MKLIYNCFKFLWTMPFFQLWLVYNEWNGWLIFVWLHFPLPACNILLHYFLLIYSPCRFVDTNVLYFWWPVIIFLLIGFFRYNHTVKLPLYPIACSFALFPIQYMFMLPPYRTYENQWTIWFCMNAHFVDCTHKLNINHMSSYFLYH